MVYLYFQRGNRTACQMLVGMCVMLSTSVQGAQWSLQMLQSGRSYEASLQSVLTAHQHDIAMSACSLYLSQLVTATNGKNYNWSFLFF